MTDPVVWPISLLVASYYIWQRDLKLAVPWLLIAIVSKPEK